MQNAPLHVRFINLLSAIRGLAPYDSMTAEEEELLRNLIVRWYSSDKITVGEIMHSLAGVSQTTAYRRLISLRDKGLIELRVDIKGRRVNFVLPTKLAEDYAERINQALAGKLA